MGNYFTNEQVENKYTTEIKNTDKKNSTDIKKIKPNIIKKTKPINIIQNNQNKNNKKNNSFIIITPDADKFDYDIPVISEPPILEKKNFDNDDIKETFRFSLSDLEKTIQPSNIRTT